LRADRVFAGVYDPLRRLDGDFVERRLREGLARFGAVTVYRAGPLIAAAASPDGRASAAVAPVLCLLDGYLEATEQPPEALLAERWLHGGETQLAALRGAFAAVVWDEERQRGCLVRDQLAQRPLFIHESGPVLSFASEVRPLLALQPQRPSPNLEAVALYLSPSESHEEPVPYEGIRRVPGGNVVRLADGRWTLERYWEPRYREPLPGLPAEHAEGIREHVAAAIHRTTAPADDVGILLSGGLDSTTVAALAAAQLRQRGGALRAYSHTFPDYPTVDENEQITALATHADIPVTRLDVRLGSSLASTLEYLDLYETPEFSATGFFWRPLARRAAADGAQVLLSGEGGDEVFGAPLHLMADRVRRGRLRDAMGLVERFPNIAYNPWRSLRARLLWEYGVLPNLPTPVQRELAARKDRRARRRYLSDHGRSLLPGPVKDPRPWRALDGPAWWAGKVDHFVRRLSEYGAPEQTTRSARLAGVTERHPLLTLDLIEFALRLPPEEGFDAHRTRPDLRRAMEGIVPDAVRLRAEKVDFDAVRGYSLLADREVIRELLGDPAARIRPFVRREVVASILDETPSRWGDLSRWGGELMRLVTLECWLRQQEDADFARRMLDSGRLTAPDLRFR
jgi:asparagine synthase (glutamine-hydrolysing)